MGETHRQRRERERPPGRPHRLADDPVWEWVTPRSVGPAEIRALAERFSGGSLDEMLRDRDFRRLSNDGMKALADEFRRRAALARADVDEDASVGSAIPWRRRR